MADAQPDAEPVDWPLIADLGAIEMDNAKAMIERADALLKAQDDGLQAMEARMSSLFGQSITLASAAVAATGTAFAARAGPNGVGVPLWAFGWAAPSLATLSGLWLAAVAVAASAMLSQTWVSAGLQPRELYSEQLLAAPPNALRLAIARALQAAIDRNARRTSRYVKRLAWVVGLLATGPLLAAVVALWLARPRWSPPVAAGVIFAGNMWLVVALYRRATGRRERP